MKKLFALLLALVLVTAASFALADWPEKDITIICTHGAGGDTDYNARLMARYLEQKLGVSVTVTNVTGSNGNIAMNQYKDGDNSGYTFVMINRPPWSAMRLPASAISAMKPLNRLRFTAVSPAKTSS